MEGKLLMLNGVGGFLNLIGLLLLGTSLFLAWAFVITGGLFVLPIVLYLTVRVSKDIYGVFKRNKKGIWNKIKNMFKKNKVHPEPEQDQEEEQLVDLQNMTSLSSLITRLDENIRIMKEKNLKRDLEHIEMEMEHFEREKEIEEIENRHTFLLSVL